MEDKKINTTSNKRSRDHDELPEAKRIRDTLLDESEFLLLENDSENQDLVSVMKSFEKEISLLPLVNKEEEEISLLQNNEVEISSLTEPELLMDFLLEASDDELGLPPNSYSSSSNEKEGDDDDDMLRVSSETTVGFDDHHIWGFEDEISRSTMTVQQLMEEKKDSCDDSEIVNFEGLFDYCDDVNDDVLSLCGISDFSDFSCRSEWLPVL